jgi:glycosyltransferase involved in cell wall biosynthesis
MRILELILAPIEGGAHTLVDGLVRQWRSQGHEVDVLALDPAPTAIAARRSRELFGFDVPIVRPKTRLMNRFPIKQGSRLVGLRQAIASGNYDVIHAHCMQPNIYSRLAAVWNAGYPPVVVTMHSPEDADYQATRARVAERALANRTSAVIAVSNETANDYRRMFPAAASKVVVIPNGLPRNVTRRTSFARSPTRFIALSRIHPQKDILTMIRGFDMFLGRSNVEGELAIAGGFDDPGYEDEVISKHTALANAARIKFLGSRSDVVELLDGSDVFVHTASREAHSVAILEAAAAALPIVASDLPAIRASLGSGAVYFRPGDAEALADALQRVTQRWPERTRLAESLAKDIVLRYSMQACAEAHLTVLERAAAAA